MHCDEACGQREVSLVPQDFQDHLSSETVYARGCTGVWCLSTTCSPLPTAAMMAKTISRAPRKSRDYALLGLCRPHPCPYMMLMVVLAVEDMAGKRIHFSGFDSDWPGELVYQFCGVEDETAHLNYQHCDARPGASGVYGKMWDPKQHKWERKVIGIFSGHKWLGSSMAVMWPFASQPPSFA
ncbi:unnamed protein product [Caretta caretta]